MTLAFEQNLNTTQLHIERSCLQLLYRTNQNFRGWTGFALQQGIRMEWSWDPVVALGSKHYNSPTVQVTSKLVAPSRQSY